MKACTVLCARDQCYAVRLPSMGAAAAAGQHGHGQQFETRVFTAGAAQVTLLPTTRTSSPMRLVGASDGRGNGSGSGNACSARFGNISARTANSNFFGKKM